jgi:hypothetical protein
VKFTPLLTTRVDIAVDTKPVPAEIVAKVPEIEKALEKCQWWHA